MVNTAFLITFVIVFIFLLTGNTLLALTGGVIYIFWDNAARPVELMSQKDDEKKPCYGVDKITVETSLASKSSNELPGVKLNDPNNEPVPADMSATPSLYENT